MMTKSVKAALVCCSMLLGCSVEGDDQHNDQSYEVTIDMDGAQTHLGYFDPVTAKLAIDVNMLETFGVEVVGIPVADGLHLLNQGMTDLSSLDLAAGDTMDLVGINVEQQSQERIGKVQIASESVNVSTDALPISGWECSYQSFCSGCSCTLHQWCTDYGYWKNTGYSYDSCSYY